MGEERQKPNKAIRWAIVLGAAILILVLPPPSGITQESWRLVAVFTGTMVGLVVQPLPGGAMVLVGVCVLAVTRIVTPTIALAGYGDPVVWLVLSAFFISRGMIKTGLGRRIALLFVRTIGRTTLGLSYALAGSEAVLAMIIPSNGARSGGIIFPIAKSLSETYDSKPGETADRLGAFLMVLLYNTCVICCAMFLTGQAANALIAGFARETAGVELSYRLWALAAFVPGVVSLVLVPLLFYRLYPPTVKHTPAATEMANRELAAMGPLCRQEKLMLVVFMLVLGLWLTISVHHIDYSAVALLGVVVLLLTGVLEWDDLLTERNGWDVFFWYGGLVQMAKLLGETGITSWFANITAGYMTGWSWVTALAVLLLVYTYAHYAFASITAHSTAMYIPFLTVIMAAGAPIMLGVLLLTFLSNIMASITHYGTTPGPIYFGAGYVPQSTWWKLGFASSVLNIVIWSTVGVAWWRVLGLW